MGVSKLLNLSIALKLCFRLQRHHVIKMVDGIMEPLPCGSNYIASDFCVATSLGAGLVNINICAFRAVFFCLLCFTLLLLLPVHLKHPFSCSPPLHTALATLLLFHRTAPFPALLSPCSSLAHALLLTLFFSSPCSSPHPALLLTLFFSSPCSSPHPVL